ncbi:MAG TPA: SpoIIE family protein phosphatase [Desulfitobacteriaceae bacterium]|nr:SpoIIE family protein phosphatase [Desulfitobacteriaceae bacterium]
MVEIKIGVVSSPRQVNSGGDAYLVKKFPGKVLIAVIDALGHGQMARRAASLTIKLLTASNDTHLEKLLTTIHKALLCTVGVVIGLVLIDYDCHLLTFAGVGNITIKLLGQNNNIEVILPAGILGYRTNNVLCQTISISEDDLLLMHTDGIINNYELSPCQLPVPQKIIQTLMSDYRRPNDDALVLIATELLDEGYEEQVSYE